MRAFVAVEISNREVIDSITKFQSKVSIKAKPVEPQNLHFTLQFLGEISEDATQKIKQALKRIKQGTFGVCLGCGDDILEKRLIARPVTTHCIDCKQLREEKERLRIEREENLEK